MRPQSRNGLISVESDNAGFARFVADNETQFNELFDAAFPGRDVTVFGEWCGGNIQTTVALAQVPKHLVVFGAYDHGNGPDSEEYIPVLDTVKFQNNHAKIFHITQAPTVSIEIDFNSPHLVQDQLSDLVEQYEEQCKWASTMFQVDGIGEGLVWTCDARPFDSDLWFKTKGDKHAKSATKSKVRIVADPEKLASVMEFVARVLPAWRLEQGLREVASEGVALTSKDTAAYLKWICGDVLKEESDTMEASGFDWKKDLSGPITAAARQFLFQHLNQEQGLN